MGRLFVFMFILPWWVYLPASIGVLWGGERVYEQALEVEAEKAAALEAAPPEPVDLGIFDPGRDIHAAGEVNVIGAFDDTPGYELVKGLNGVAVSTRYLHVIFGADEGGSNVVRAALMLDRGEEAALLAGKATEWSIDVSADDALYRFNGFAKTTNMLDEMADEAIEGQGLTKAEDFIYVEPFFDGREAALAPRGVPEQTRYIAWAIAGILALIGVVKRVTSVRAGLAREVEVDLTRGGAAPVGGLAPGNAPSAPAHEATLVYSAYGTMTSDLYEDEDEDEDDETIDSFDEKLGESLAFEGEPDDEDAPESSFPPIPDDHVQAVPDRPQRSSAAAFYGKLAVAMMLVGLMAYDPSLITAALPVAGVALFWLGLYIGFGRLRRGAKPVQRSGKVAPEYMPGSTP